MPKESPTAVAARLRALPALAGHAPVLDLHALPGDPVELFLRWLDDAVTAGLAEPHAMTLATVGADGIPDARTLILKDVSSRGWAFAGTRSSMKGEQLAAHPVAALSIWWQPQVRAIRVRGRVEEASPEERAADLAARSAAARADVAHDDWMLWRLVPDSVEFWQGSADRRHVRIVYRREGSGWRRSGAGAER